MVPKESAVRSEIPRVREHFGIELDFKSALPVAPGHRSRSQPLQVQKLGCAIKLWHCFALPVAEAFSPAPFRIHRRIARRIALDRSKVGGAKVYSAPGAARSNAIARGTVETIDWLSRHGGTDYRRTDCDRGRPVVTRGSEAVSEDPQDVKRRCVRRPHD